MKINFFNKVSGNCNENLVYALGKKIRGLILCIDFLLQTACIQALA